MYIRRVSRKNKVGSKVSYIQPAHIEWDSKAKFAKAKAIYTLAVKLEDKADIAILGRLAQSISRFLTPEEALKSKQQIGNAEEFQFHSAKQVGGVWLYYPVDPLTL
ncbi:hypothetical protein ACDX78_11940 [Virgibacillus oceani]